MAERKDRQQLGLADSAESDRRSVSRYLERPEQVNAQPTRGSRCPLMVIRPPTS